MRAVDAKDSRTCFNISEDIVPIISLKNITAAYDIDSSSIKYREVYINEKGIVINSKSCSGQSVQILTWLGLN